MQNDRNTLSTKQPAEKEKVVWDLKPKKRIEYDALLRNAGSEPDEDD